MKTQTNPLFTMTVLVKTLALQGSLTATFEAKRNSELKVLDAKGAEMDNFVRAVTRRVENVQLSVPLQGLDASGNFDSQADGLTELLDWPGVAGALYRAYYKGLYEEEEKNSAPPVLG